LYRRAREIYDDDDAVNDWEEVGGRNGELYDISRELHLAPSRPPWEEDIFVTIDEGTPRIGWIARGRKSLYAIRVGLDRLLRAATRKSACSGHDSAAGPVEPSR
jgi:hypothetical protein